MKRVLFVCVHNAGRSQMAEAFFNEIARERGLDARAESAGTAPGERVNPVAAQAMEEAGISLESRRPKQLTPETAAQADRIITMGCGVEADMCPAGTYISEDWGLPDPHGRGSSFGPALFAGGAALSSYWVYVVGPVLGAVIAARLYEALRGSEEHAQGAPNDLYAALEKVEHSAG